MPEKFRYEALQDSKSIRKIIEALAAGIDKGELLFSDDEQSIELKPEGLLSLKVSASKEDGISKFNLRVSWQNADEIPAKRKSLKIQSKNTKKK